MFVAAALAQRDRVYLCISSWSSSFHIYSSAHGRAQIRTRWPGESGLFENDLT